MIAPPVDRGLIAAAKDVATTVEISSTKLTEPANSAATSAAMGNRAGMTRAYPAQDAGGCGKDGGGGFFRHQAGEEVGDQVDAAQLLDDINQGAHAADEHQSSPGDTLNGFLFIGAAQQNQHGGGNEGKQSGVKLEADAADNHDNDGRDGAKLILVKFGNFRQLQRVVGLNLVTLKGDVQNQREEKAGN